tara:strand:- start:149 stop:403 length:255 start_codon:yes stop_codon:yes gene_type:complete
MVNERIEQMMADASGGACYDGNQLALYGEDIEKFAELIVRECITHIEQDRFRCADLLETEYDDGYADGMGHAERMLKKHFGVEE